MAGAFVLLGSNGGQERAPAPGDPCPEGRLTPKASRGWGDRRQCVHKGSAGRQTGAAQNAPGGSGKPRDGVRSWSGVPRRL